jgi:hypothetical protein
MGIETGIRPPTGEAVEAAVDNGPTTGVRGFENPKLSYEGRVAAMRGMVGEKPTMVDGTQFEQDGDTLRIRMPEEHGFGPGSFGWRTPGVQMVEVTPDNIEAVSNYMRIPAAERRFFTLSADNTLDYSERATESVNAGVAGKEFLKNPDWVKRLNAVRRGLAERRLQMLYGNTHALEALNKAGMGGTEVAKRLAKNIDQIRSSLRESAGGADIFRK